MTDEVKSVSLRQLLNPAVVVGALGYFVDIYDLLLFNIVRIPSLKSLGVSGAGLVDTGLTLLNLQMAGALVGGVLFGILGDRKGRMKILFGSILLYSIATLGNAFVTDVNQYAILRFVAGIGLAGELGAGITLVAESLPVHLRGYGTAIVPAFGVTGALLADTVARNFDWRTAYIVGGSMGLLLLLLRIGVYESKLFTEARTGGVAAGNFLALFTSFSRFRRFSCSFLLGLPLWFIVGLLVALSPEFGVATGAKGPISAGTAVVWTYAGFATGDLASGFLSQAIRSRRRALGLFLGLTAASVAYYMTLSEATPRQIYVACGMMGFSGGYWAVMLTLAAESFGTNLRATVTTSVPNFVRGALIPVTAVFQALRVPLGLLPAAAVVGASCLLIAILAILPLKETWGKDLDFVE